MVRILALCHGHEPNNPTKTICNTSLVDISKAVFLDKDKRIKPDILCDFKKPFFIRKRLDIITTVCCDTDLFYDLDTKQLEIQTLLNIVSLLKPHGIFIIPQYTWLNRKVKKKYRFVL